MRRGTDSLTQVEDEYARSIVVNDETLIQTGQRTKRGLRSLDVEGLLLSIAALITIF